MTTCVAEFFRNFPPGCAGRIFVRLDMTPVLAVASELPDAGSLTWTARAPA